MKKRIWELDALRGLFILCMVAVHLVYDLVELFGLVRWEYPPVFLLVMNWGGVLFFLLSGICATLGSRSVRRGLIVLGCGLLCTAVTYGMYRLGMADRGLIIYFGVLHCLGACMLLWPVFKKWPAWALAAAGVALAALGLYMRSLPPLSHNWLTVLGWCGKGFASSDYFPLLPNLGYFLLGGFLGKTLYRRRESLLPKLRGTEPGLNVLCFCGRQSLLIYLLHQPVLYGICWCVDTLL